MTEIKEIFPAELKAWSDAGKDFLLLDVRTENEMRQGMLPGGVPQSMRSLPADLHRFDRHSVIVVYCRSGIRSAQVCGFMANNGFTNTYNLRGGILQWAGEGLPVVQYGQQGQKAGIK